MPKLDRTVIHHSVNDVIEILENQPVRGDLIAELPAVQTMNRISIAHLSIERAMKFVITEAGGEFKPNHDLPSRLNELREREPNSAKFLEEAFEDAVRHYRYNANVGDLSHLKSLETYLEATGTDRHFQDIRYWELDHTITFRPISLTLHLELLHAMSEILLAPERPKDTVSRRVERAVQKAMTSTWSYTVGSEKEISVKAYIDWLQGFGGFCEAMTQAFMGGVSDGDSFMLETLNGAYQEISMSTDPAVRYFAETLTVLPKQQRDATPCVEWLGPESYRRGMVSTPGGEVLGFIDRRTDGKWNIIPSKEGLITVSAVAESQTDARCYLADMLTRTAKLTVGNEHKQVRIVGEEYDLFKQNYASDWLQLGAPGTTFQVTFWDETHGLDIGNMVKLETECQPSEGVVQILQGTVTHVKNHEVTVEGTTYFDAKC